MTCDRFREIVVGIDDPTLVRSTQGDVADHAESCADCRQWLDRYATGAALWREDTSAGLAATVVARTAGPACERARVLLASDVDEAVAPDDAVLLRAHVARCDACRAFKLVLDETMAALPALSVLDPGPAFAAQVLARTSRRPAAPTLADRAQAAWGRVVGRPRFAWEVAYVFTLCWLLVFGHPIDALNWTTARVGAAARTAVPATVQTAETRVHTLRDQLTADVARTAERIADRRETVGGAARSTWQRGDEWMLTRMAGMADALVSSWRSLAAWLTDLFGVAPAATTSAAPPPTEPPAAPAR